MKKDQQTTQSSSLRNNKLTIDRLKGLTYIALTKKYKCNSPAQARAYHFSTLNHIVSESKKLTALVIKACQINERKK
jgi:hypothetical protein